MQFLGSLLFKFFTYSFALIPFPLLYLHSDILAFFLNKVIKYRRDVVYQNIKNSFPEKSEEELLRITKKFYKNLSDITLEGIKGFTIGRKKLMKRYLVKNTELIDEYFEKGQSVIAMVSHFTNWEWGAFIYPSQIKHTNIALYKPIKNKYIDKFVKKSRAALGMELVSIFQTARSFIKHKDNPVIVYMIADQSPSNMEKAIWVDFLNRDTACLHGAEGYAKKFNLPLVYFDVQRVKRGYYEVTLSKMIENPKETEHGEITQVYMKKLEEIIQAEPENWLWSHRRWKHKRTKSST